MGWTNYILCKLLFFRPQELNLPSEFTIRINLGYPLSIDLVGGKSATRVFTEHECKVFSHPCLKTFCSLFKASYFQTRLSFFFFLAKVGPFNLLRTQWFLKFYTKLKYFHSDRSRRSGLHECTHPSPGSPLVEVGIVL